MMSFRDNYLDNAAWPNVMICLIGEIREFKGKEALFEKQAPEVLRQLKEVAVIQSVESSNRLEGIEVAKKRLALLTKDKTSPMNRSEAEVAGYRDVLNTIHVSASYMALSPSLMLQMHRDLMSYATGSGGRWKASDNVIKESLPSGQERIRFVPVPAWRTPEAIGELLLRFQEAKNMGNVDDLLLIGAFVLDFLSIHPFADGNGRMARLLTLLLMYQSGYQLGKYISLEKIIEETKESYYETLEKSSQGWHEGKHDIIPWLTYFLNTILKAYQRFEERVGTVRQERGWKEKHVREVISTMESKFRIADLLERCPDISRPTIQRVLNKMSHAGEIECLGKGKNALWQKRSSK
ncbi:Fic family protein [Heliorestis acidaminivorans]|uniref:Fic family protein n=1 Tax=Heliorestis acidaminivorans TaxID=553427 RepID=A0A6I0EZ58_9FIRM|nr:Fic family protein [Heliorestis acidaminivorans]KAB2952142.1 Fic family protein [Heliorestis acidaminivorans]